MLLNAFVFAAATAVLIGGAVLVVDSSASIARRIGISALTIGLSIVAIGTSAPEMAVTVLAAARGIADISLGNIAGSNIFNLLAVLGIAAVVRHVPLARSSFRYEIPMCVGSAALLLLFARTRELIRLHGVVFLFLFVLFVAYTVFTRHHQSVIEEVSGKRLLSIPTGIIAFIAGAAMLILGAHFVVESAVEIAHALHVSKRVVALTAVAIATSLPEMATSVTAVVRGQSDLAVGNAVGSTLLNTLFILGTTVAVAPIPVPQAAFTDLLVFLAAALLLLLFALTPSPGRLHRIEGIVLLVGYLAYLVVVIYGA